MIVAYNSPLTVPSPGTPVQVTGKKADPQSGYEKAHGILIQVLPNNTGKIYVGLKTMNKGTFQDVLAFLAVPTINLIPSFSATLTLAPGGIQLRDLWVDADQAGEGVVVTILIA